MIGSYRNDALISIFKIRARITKKYVAMVLLVHVGNISTWITFNKFIRIFSTNWNQRLLSNTKWVISNVKLCSKL